MSKIATAVRLATAAFAITTAKATEYNVSPDGSPMSLAEALAVAGAGDIVVLADGIYREPLVTQNGGEEDNPLVIEGSRNAVINGFTGVRGILWSQKMVDLRHSYVTLRGFTVNGRLEEEYVEESFVDKCVWVGNHDLHDTIVYKGQDVVTALNGAIIEDLHIHNCGMECIRARNWVTNMVIKDNHIEDCGRYDFRFQFDGGKVGEAIYIGTSSNQWRNGTILTHGADASNFNLVANNIIAGRGNECVDIKEGSSFNVVEHNVCSNQNDAESGCLDSRGNENTFRFNDVRECQGAGIRLGGHFINDTEFGIFETQYGLDNHVYGNSFIHTGAQSVGARQHPQGVICENSCVGDEDACEVGEKGPDDEIAASFGLACPDLPFVPFIDE